MVVRIAPDTFSHNVIVFKMQFGIETLQLLNSGSYVLGPVLTVSLIFHGSWVISSLQSNHSVDVLCVLRISSAVKSSRLESQGGQKPKLSGLSKSWSF